MYFFSPILLNAGAVKLTEKKQLGKLQMCWSKKLDVGLEGKKSFNSGSGSIHTMKCLSVSLLEALKLWKKSFHGALMNSTRVLLLLLLHTFGGVFGQERGNIWMSFLCYCVEMAQKLVGWKVCAEKFSMWDVMWKVLFSAGSYKEIATWEE